MQLRGGQLCFVWRATVWRRASELGGLEESLLRPTPAVLCGPDSLLAARLLPSAIYYPKALQVTSP